MPTLNDPMEIRRPSIKTRASEYNDYRRMVCLALLSKHQGPAAAIAAVKRRINGRPRNHDSRAVY